MKTTLFLGALLITLWCAHAHAAERSTFRAAPVFRDSMISYLTAEAAASIDIDPTQREFVADHSSSFHAKGMKAKGVVGEVSIDANVGTIELRGKKFATFIQKRIPWGDLTLFQGIATDPKNFYVYWLYCSKENQLYAVYYESTEMNTATVDPVAGSCQTTFASTRTVVEAPAIHLPNPEPLKGFEIAGKYISLKSGQSGWLLLGYDRFTRGRPLRFVPFSLVNCSRCGTPGTSDQAGWYELHSMLWNDQKGAACFGIIYLFRDKTKPITLGHTQCFPDVSYSVPATAYDAAWDSDLDHPPAESAALSRN